MEGLPGAGLCLHLVLPAGVCALVGKFANSGLRSIVEVLPADVLSSFSRLTLCLVDLATVGRDPTLEKCSVCLTSAWRSGASRGSSPQPGPRAALTRVRSASGPLGAPAGVARPVVLIPGFSLLCVSPSWVKTEQRKV